MFIVEKAIVRFEFMTLTAAGLGIGSIRLSRLGRNNFDQPVGQSLVSQLTIGEFLLGPACTLQATLHLQGFYRGWLGSDAITKIIHQRIQINILDALGLLVWPVAPTALGPARRDPIGRFVTAPIIG